MYILYEVAAGIGDRLLLSISVLGICFHFLHIPLPKQGDVYGLE